MREENDVITDDTIRKVVKMLKESDRFEKEQREKRRLKDYSKMAEFHKRLKESDMPLGEKMELGETIEMLAQGYYLILGEKFRNDVVPELREKWAVPEEVIANIFVSPHLSTKKE